MQIPLVVFADLQARIFGFLPAEHRWLPTHLVPELGPMLQRIRDGREDGSIWVPSEVEVQIACLGSLAIVGIGAEPSTVAGWRMRASVGHVLRSCGLGVVDVVLSTYTNGYIGYLVTPEEHLDQGYESGATLFGRWSLPAWQTLLDGVARTLGGA